MGTHPIFESDFDCLTDCQALRLAFEMAKKETEDVTKLSNKELKEKLTSLGITAGPIVDSTRKIYERKLEKLLAKGKDLAYSTDEDAVPEQEIETEEAEPVKEKKVTRTKKAPKSDPVVEEKFSDEEDEEPVVKNSSSRRRSARILKSKSKKDTDVEQIEEQEEEAEEEAEVEQEEESVEANKDEEVEVAKDESKSTESVQVLSTKTAITSHIHTILFLALVAIAGYLLYSEADAIQSA